MNFTQHGFDYSEISNAGAIRFDGGATDSVLFKTRVQDLFKYSDLVAIDFYTTIGYKHQFELTPYDGLFADCPLTHVLYYPRYVKEGRRVYEIPHIQYLTEPQINLIIEKLHELVDVESRYKHVLTSNMPRRIDTITQADVDKTYIDSFDFIELKGNDWTFIDIEHLTFAAVSTQSTNGLAKRNGRDLMNRIKKQNNQIPKMSASHWEILHVAARMCKDGKFQEVIRRSIEQILSTFLMWITVLQSGTKRINFSRYIFNSNNREDMLILRDSNFPIRLSMVSQACYVLASMDGYQQVTRCINVVEKLLIWQCFRQKLDVAPKDIINTFSLYNGIQGLEQSTTERGTPNDYRTKHCHPCYTVNVEEMFAGPPEWVQPIECNGCTLGNYDATLALRREMYLTIVEKYKKSCADLFEIFPDFERDLRRLLILRPNYNLIRISRCIVTCLVVPFISGPSATIAKNEIKNIDSHKQKSDMYRAQNRQDYQDFKELVDDTYNGFIKNCAQVANITPLEVSNNLESYVSNNSASMGSVTLECDLGPERGMRAEKFEIRTTSKRIIVAFSKGKKNLLTQYMLTETLQQYKLRIRDQKDNKNKKRRVSHQKWNRKTVGVREDPGREPRQMYQQDLYTIQAENVVARHILDGSTGSPVHGYNVDWYGPERPSEIMTNAMVNQISMICKICMADLRPNYFSFSTDASSFDKSSRCTEYFDTFFKLLAEYQVKYHPGALYHVDAGVTVDGKRVNFCELIKLLRDVYRAPTFEIPGQWSSLALTASYTNSGSTITFMQNSMTNIANQHYMIRLLNDICIKSGCEGLLQTSNVVVAGDDAVSTVHVRSGVFNREFFDKVPEAFDKLALISGYSLSTAKGAIFGTEVAKLYTVCGMVMNHKATTLNREKKSTAQSTVEGMSSISTLKFLTMERSLASDDTAIFLNALGGMRLLQNTDDGLYVVLTSAIVSTLPSRNGGAGFPLFIDMNEPIITLFLTHGFYTDVCLLFGLAEILKEKTGSTMRERLRKCFSRTLKTGKGINFRSNIEGVEFEGDNLKHFFPTNKHMIDVSRNSLSQISKRAGGRLVSGDNAIKNILYENSQERAVEMIVNGIQLPIYEEEGIRLDLMTTPQHSMIFRGRTLVNRMRDDDPLFGHIIISKIEFETWKEDFITPFPCSHQFIHKMTAHYGMKAGRVVSFDYLAFLDRILGKYGNMAKVAAIASINFLTTMLNQKFRMDTDNLRLVFSMMYGLEPERIEESDMMQLSSYLQSEQTYLHMSEPSTSMVYISDAILERITLHSTKVARNRKKLITSLKHLVITICRIYDMPVKTIEFVLPDQYVDIMKYYSDRLDVSRFIALGEDSHS